MLKMSDPIEKLIEKVDKKFKHQREKFEPFVRKIRFPRYKSLKRNSEINFEFPLTVLVGVNGTNKTSILQALYGVPGHQSVGKYWFSTDVDKIDDIDEQSFSDIDKIDEDELTKHSLIYTYFHKKANKNVEVLKTRVNRKDRKDYWEPSRAILKYNMIRPEPKELSQAENKSKTRWDTMDKPVLFCDFKEYISAFDMYFYNFIFEPSSKYRTKQDFLRSRSQRLSEAVDNDLESYSYFRIERIEDNYVVSDEVKGIVSDILDQEYEEIRIINHKFYFKNNVIRPLKTILMKKNNLNYTEAFAGSGESRLIMLINDIVNADNNSLILIDEPEINLHPKAISRFQIFLLQQILNKNHQIVLTTHSHYLVNSLPKRAIKLMQNLDNNIVINEDVDYRDAFLVLGETLDKNINVVVEDLLVKSMLDYSMEKADIKSMKEVIHVDFLAGGVESIIKQHIYSSALKKDRKTFYVLDGDVDYLRENNNPIIKDEWIRNNKISSECISSSENEKLEDVIRVLTGINMKFDTNSGENKEIEKYELQRQFLDFWKSNVFFLNSTTPEQAILESKNIPLENGESAKDYFKRVTEDDLLQAATGEEILFIQKKMYNNLEENTPLKEKVNEILTTIWEKSKN